MPPSCLIPCVKEPQLAQAQPSHVARVIPRRTGAVAPDRFEKTPPPKKRVAVLFNVRARRVTPEVTRRLEKIVGAKNTFYSHTLEEARQHIARIAAAGYETLVCCGGDGTLVTAMNMMRKHMADQPEPRPMPRFAQLTLGTGNALRQVVAAGDPAADLRNIRAGHIVDRPLSLIEDHNKTAFFFAGIGHDARLMHDYDEMQHTVPGCMARSVMRSKFGFATALVSRTMPYMARHAAQTRASVTANGPCYRVSRHKGRDTLTRVPPGEIFRGPIGMLGVGTVPWLGYDIHMFPCANTRPGMMHLRITQMSLFGMLTQARALWRGTFNHATRCHDFLVTDVDVRLDRPLHYQHSGESQGRVTRVHFGVAPNAITLAAQRRASK